MIFILGLCVVFHKIAYAEGKIDVFVSIAPQKYFVEKIAQTQVEVSVMVQPGASPATYEPKPKQMIALSKTKIYFAIGVPFEQVWLKKIAVANPNMQIINTQNGITKIPMETYHQHEREHPKGTYNNIIHDPHIWLSPNLVKIQARNILNALLVKSMSRGLSSTSRIVRQLSVLFSIRMLLSALIYLFKLCDLGISR